MSPYPTVVMVMMEIQKGFIHRSAVYSSLLINGLLVEHTDGVAKEAHTHHQIDQDHVLWHRSHQALGCEEKVRIATIHLSHSLSSWSHVVGL